MSRRSAILSLFAVNALSILGVILAQSIPNAVFPEFVFHRAIILADSAELPASQVLVAVTRPLEEAAYSVPGTTLVRSTTTRGSAEIDVYFAERTDPTTSFELLGAALAGTIVTFVVTIWGWRAAFVLPVIVALLAVYVRLLCPESPRICISLRNPQQCCSKTLICDSQFG